MEHKLILGGEQYLPFARSRVAQLKKLGCTHAAQSYEIDGVSIKVRIEPGHEYIRIEGNPKQVLLMDSGIVDVADTYSFPYTSCLLLKAPENLAYEGVGFDSEFREDPVHGTSQTKSDTKNRDSHGQMKGEVVKFIAFTGFARDGSYTARSFEKNYIYTNEPPAWAVTPGDDDALLDKKLIALKCPASIFTGRCRLYVQSLYGQYLYAYDTTKKRSTCNTKFSVYGGSGDGIPHLVIDSFPRAGLTPVAVRIDTSTGVYLDDLTGKHWLINITASEVVAYPLISKHEKLRTWLRASALSKISAVDKEHLEAYILSSCLPDDSNKQRVTLNTPANGAIAYGWHWNFSGDKADLVNVGAIVVNEGVPNTLYVLGEHMQQVSTHYRVLVGFNNSVFGASLEVVTPETKWSVYPSNNCILSPDWAGGFQKVLIPAASMHAAITPAADVPIYAFYVGDTLNLCTITVQVSYPGDDVVYQDPPNATQFQAAVPTTDSYYTMGARAGFVEKRGGGTNTVDGGRIVEVSFNIQGAGTSISGLYYNKNEFGFRCDTSEKTQLGHGSLTRFTPNMARTANYGYPDSLQTVSWTGFADFTVICPMTYKTDVGDLSYSEVGRLLIVPPKYDSESIIYSTSKTTTRTVSSVRERTYDTPYFAQFFDTVDSSGTVFGPGYYLFNDFQSGEGSTGGTKYTDTSVGDYTINAPTTAQAKLAGRADASITVPMQDEYFDAGVSTITDITFDAYSGVSRVNPFAMAPGYYAPVLAGVSASTKPAVLGWA